MAYRHNGRRVVTFRSDPIDPDSTDWVFFSYADWLRDGETINAHSAIVSNAEIITDSIYLGTIPDEDGTEYDEVYAVQVKPTGAGIVTVTHRVSTTTTGADLARLDIDHTIQIPVQSL